MDREQILQTLHEYAEELYKILARFTKDYEGLHIAFKDDSRLMVISTELLDFIHDHIPNSAHHALTIEGYYNQGKRYGSSSYESVEQIRGVVKSLKTRIERNPSLLEPVADGITVSPEENKKFDGIEVIANRFHSVVMQLRQRHDKRKTLDVNDEYDVQDIFHSLLMLYFNDIRTEEWVPTYAGGASRSDFLLPEINTVIEIKKTRESMSTKQLGDQLIVDIAKYKKHPQCSRLICFVYDPEGRIKNPRGIENDLSDCDSDIEVRSIIVPKHI